MLTEDRAQEIADQLIGTCNMLHNIITLEEQEDTDLLTALDDLAVECVRCGWWVEADDAEVIDDEHVCNECLDG